ncbi:MAG: propanediol/glycerol family dehydratase large subunit [Dongiaceae bacterium]
MRSMTARPANRWRRFDVWDKRPLRLDRFAVEDAENGFCASDGPFDPSPSLRMEKGRIVEIDGVAEADFDVIDTFIARHSIDSAVAEEAMAVDSLAFARQMVDINVPRAKLVRLAKGMTPAKLAQIFSHLSTLELTFAQAKLRTRHRPGNQAHVTNAKDDPLQLAADAATAVLYGFDEIETTMRVARNSWSNALACIVGAATHDRGVLSQCSIEEAEELKIGIAGLTSYAETISVYGTEQSFIDGDDTPWSKGFLLAAYASRGIKTRCTSGGGSELLMGFHSAKSIFYLEARCLCMLRGMGTQGVQNGGIDGAPITSSVPGGGREILAENVLAALLDLECASGNDTRTSSSEMRVGAKILPFLLSGTDFICSGFGSILAYDNSFAASLFNGEEIEEFLALQRDYMVEGGLTPIKEGEVVDFRRRAVDALSAVLEELSLARPSSEMKESVVYAAGSRETITFSGSEITAISEAIRDRGITLLDAIKVLARRGFRREAENLMRLLRLRVAGDHLQTAAILRDEDVVSAINEPNTYSGPGSGYRINDRRRKEISAMRDSIDRLTIVEQEGIRNDERVEQRRYRLTETGIAHPGGDVHEVVVALSPAWGEKLFRTTAGHLLSDVLRALLGGIEEGNASWRIVKVRHTADTSFLGLTAARLAGSGHGIGVQAKGTAVIHRKDRMPHLNLELFSMAPMTGLEHYRALGRNAAALALGESPEPVLVPYDGHAVHARHHVRTAFLYRIETDLVHPLAEPMDLTVEFLT